MRATGPFHYHDKAPGSDDEGAKHRYSWITRHKEGKKRGLSVQEGRVRHTEASGEDIVNVTAKTRHARTNDPARHLMTTQRVGDELKGHARRGELKKEFLNAAADIRAHAPWLPPELALDLVRFNHTREHRQLGTVPAKFDDFRSEMDIPDEQVILPTLADEDAPVKIGRRDLGKHDPRPKRAKR